MVDRADDDERIDFETAFEAYFARGDEDRARFGRILRTLIRVALENGVDVAGSLTARHEGALPDYDVEFTELRKLDRERD